jgi:hypothetical protein
MAVILALLGVPALAQKDQVRSTTRILYHDGPVVDGALNVYFVLYGCWETSVCGTGTDTATINLLTDLIIGLGGTPYMNINTLYPDMYGSVPSGGVVFGGAGSDLYSHGASMTDADVQNVIMNQIWTGRLPTDTRGIYIVLTTPDVTVDGFCTNFAQYHSRFVDLGIRYNYAFVGNPWRCPISAAPQFASPTGTLLPTPNGNFAADGMASSIAHVIAGTLTNPIGGGWYDRYGLENSDKCQGTFGQTYTTPNGAQANMRITGHDYLIQQNWVNDRKGRCAISYP